MADDEARVCREYGALAADYDSRWAAYLGFSHDLTLSQLPRQTPRAVLDAGCGTGLLLRRLARRWPDTALTGLDLTPAMLEVAATRLGRRAALVHGSLLRLPFTAGSFDLLITSSAVHYLDDPVTAVTEMQRVLAPGGRLVFTDWCADYWPQRMLARLLRATGRAHGQALGLAELEQALERAGFVVESRQRARLGWLWQLMSVRAERL
ncbi:MAG: methyltransferase domain-containing protein [Pseudomonadota bacterium]